MRPHVTELRFAPVVSAMYDYLDPYQPWIKSVLGCDLPQTITFDIDDLDLGQLAVEKLLPTVPWDGHETARIASIQPIIERVEIPPGMSPRMELHGSRKRGTLATDREFAWHAEWMECPVALWLRGGVGPAVVVKVPYVSFLHGGPTSLWKTSWLLAKQSCAAEVLNALSVLVQDSKKRLKMFGQRSIELGAAEYDWDAVVLDPATTDLLRRDFESFFDREAWFRKHRLPFRRGYLLYGPPGNGKTSAIRVMASHPAITPMTLDFYNEHLDNEALTALFESAAQSAPSLVIFEDLDRVFTPTAGQDERIKISFDHLLNCLDGVAIQDGIIVVATANNPSVLGAAITRRPGRFDRVIGFPPPSKPLRRQFIEKLAGTLDSDSLDVAAAESEGFSYAQLREGYILAAQFAFERGDSVNSDDVLSALTKMRGTSVELSSNSGLQAGFRTARG
jgi:hypothetical protein